MPATVYFETSAEYSAATRRYTVGVFAQWDASRALAVEVDALYHRIGYTGIVRFFSSTTGVLTISALDVKGHSWEFPLLVKRRLALG